MSIQSIAHSIQMLPMMTSVRESTLAYPIIISTHLACIALCGGMILMTNLRLLGLAFTNYSVTDIVKGLRPFKHTGLLVIIICGLLLGTAEAEKYYANPFFHVKMTMLLLAIVHAFYFRASVYKNTEALDRAPTPPGNAKAAAILSSVIWITIACMGRLIAYYEVK